MISIESYDKDDSSTFMDGFPPDILTLESTPDGNESTKTGQSVFLQSLITFTLMFEL